EFRRTLIVREVARQLTENIAVSEIEARVFYDENREALIGAAQWRVREIVVPTKEEAANILGQILVGTDFAQMARQHSKGETAANGGDLGFITEEPFPQMGNTLLSLEVGGVSGVFKGPDGYYIAKLEEKKGGEQIEFEEIKEDIIQSQTLLKQQQVILADMDDLRNQLQQARDTVRQLIGEEDSEERKFTLSEAKIDHIRREILEHIEGDAAEKIMPILDRLKRIPTIRLLKKYRSLVDQIAEKLDKRVELLIEDPDETELTPEFFHRLDPLFLHVIRNAIDHGIEQPEERLQSGKDAVAKICLKFRKHDGGLKITIFDDGRGIDTELLRKVGLERGFIRPENAQRMSREDILRLLFIPGFSSAKTVSDLSGRGVGLDVVKTELEKMGGRMRLITKTGLGTTFEFFLQSSHNSPTR
ncbi:MAG: peptidylprolyl isomerase, partial [SAR324 cluster bacterium]|nr:peptidylprolyl isomerase [SAR324 cluster bacterium]